MDSHRSIMERNDSESGYLGLYVGPMYSGKTSKLQELYKQYKFCSIPTMVINYAADTRYSSDNVMCTHDRYEVPCVMCTTLTDALPHTSKEFLDTKVFLINEGQFFPDIVEWVEKAISSEHNKSVYVCGLDGDFKRKKFGNWLDLIPLCDSIEKFRSICVDCKQRSALFSHRLTEEQQQTLIGSDCYIPLCRQCYSKRNA